MIIKNAKIVNAVDDSLTDGSIYFKDKIFAVDKQIDISSEEVYDAHGAYALPGLIDAHTHIEISMARPSVFGSEVAKCGTTSLVCDPHDLCNVVGYQIDDFMEEAHVSQANFYFMLPPTIPSTKYKESSGYETKPQDFLKAWETGKYIGVGEFIDSAVFEDSCPTVLPYMHDKIIDGHYAHGESYEDPAIEMYFNLTGAATNHEMFEEGKRTETFYSHHGIKRILRRGILKENVKNGEMACTDGMPIDFIKENGHMNFVLRELVKDGIEPAKAIRMATSEPAKHYRLDRKGQLKKGYDADIILVEDMENFKIKKVWIGGDSLKKEIVSNKNTYKKPLNIKVNVNKIDVKSQEIIKLIPDTLLTEKGSKKENVVVVANRYGEADFSSCYVEGFGLRNSAVAGSIAQDTGNIVAVGSSLPLIKEAIKKLPAFGGITFTKETKTFIFPLSMAGLMSEDENPCEDIKSLNALLRQSGCASKHPLYDLMMHLTLICIPELKISDRGVYES